MRMSNQSKYILTAAIALLAFAAFVVLGTRDSNGDAQKRLNALQATTSTSVFEEPTSTTSTSAVPATTTTSLAVTVTTAAPTPTPTTAKKTTATTKKPTTATTKKPTTATTTASSPAPPHNGLGQETADNAPYAFTLPSGPT